MSNSPVHVIRGTENEPAFLGCWRNLRHSDGSQGFTIVSVDEIRLEKREATNGPTWSVALADAGFTSKQILDDSDSGFSDAIIGALVSIGNGPHDTEAVYRIVAERTVEGVASLGGAQSPRTFVRPARIADSVATAPAS